MTISKYSDKIGPEYPSVLWSSLKLAASAEMQMDPNLVKIRKSKEV